MTPKTIHDLDTLTQANRKLARISLRAGANCVEIRPHFSFDSKYLLVASGWEIKVLSTSSGECVAQLAGHQSPIVSIQRNPINHVQILSCSEDGIVIYWDYVDGVILKKFQIHNQSVYCFFAPCPENIFYFVSKDLGFYGLYSLNVTENKSYSETDNRAELVVGDVLPDHHCLDFGSKGEYFVSIAECELKILLTKNGSLRRHNAPRRLVCVACHPHDAIVATGDEIGCITVWGNILRKSHATRSIYHWHTLPVADLAFSPKGTYLLSGGGECVLLKWNLRIEDRQFLPRMGLPICQIVMAPDSSLVATGHVDNAICLVSPQNELVQFYQGLCQGHPWKDQLITNQMAHAVPTGLIYDPHRRALVLNGRPGHIQFYLVHQDKQLFSLDITGQNYITRERERIIANTIVEKVALTVSSTWLATVQRRDDGITSAELSLKLWKWIPKSQIFSLNTSVFLPHNKKVNALCFQSIKSDNPLLVSTSDDCKFKIWSLNTDDTIMKDENNEGMAWSCSSMGYYRDLPAGDACFSQDGSVLAVAFNHAVTLWVSQIFYCKEVLINPDVNTSKSRIKQIQFGQEVCSHLLLAVSEDQLIVWNVITLTITWHISMEIDLLISDPFSQTMVVFSKNGTMFAFRPDNPKPFHIQPNASNCPVLAGVFVPVANEISNDTSDSLSWLNKCELYFMNSRQELMVGSREDYGHPRTNIYEEGYKQSKKNKIPRTQFEALMAEQVKSDIEVYKQQQYKSKELLDTKVFEQILNVPSHVLPPTSTLCLEFLTSLLVSKKS